MGVKQGIIFFVLCGLAFNPNSQAAEGSSSTVRIEPIPRHFFELGPQWRALEPELKNATQFVQLASGARRVEIARLTVYIEKRQDHEAAVERLVEIAEERESRFSFINIAGWPAFERSYLAPPDKIGTNQAHADLRYSRMTTAIAADRVLIRLEAIAAPAAARDVIDGIRAIGRSYVPPRHGDDSQTEKTIRALRASLPTLSSSLWENSTQRPGLEAWPTPPAALLPSPAAFNAPVDVHDGVGELEIAVSESGNDVVIATNSGFSVSNDGGLTFSLGGPAGSGVPTIGFPMNGDPSVAVGESGTFYMGVIAFPDGSLAAGSLNGCSTAISTSTDNGQNFNFVGNAAFCNSLACFPDQHHIAADRFNSAGGNDQVYSVWRNFTFSTGNCANVTVGNTQNRISCSVDSGANWTAPSAMGSGDFPRVAVGPDGFVYSVYRNGRNLMINKFSSCQNGLAQQDDFPKRIAKVDDVVCAVPGLDRCNSGNLLSSHTVAVDDENPEHVYVAYADNIANSETSISEDIVVRASLDGGLSWPRTGIANSGATARRFMPWICTQNQTAFVSWYDRRAATNASNDLTDFYLGSVRLGNVSDQLVTNFEMNLSVNPDSHCSSPWPLAPRAAADSESCSDSLQPVLAGVCTVSGARCDFSDGGCPIANEVCGLGGGMPKYGDYNGIACANGKVYTAWASATAPPNLATPAGIAIYSSVFETASLNTRIHVSPSSDPGKFTVSVDGSPVVSGGPLAASGFLQTGPGNFSLSVSGIASTSVNDYITTFGQDCSADGSVTLDFGERKTCTMTAVAKSGTAGCLEDCADARDECMQDPLMTPQVCVAMFRACQDVCRELPSQGTVSIDFKLDPPTDPGRFNIGLDGRNRVSGIGDGVSTGQLEVPAGKHVVSVSASADTRLDDYTITIGGQCASDGEVLVHGGSTRNCTITAFGRLPDPIAPQDRDQCRASCSEKRDICMRDPLAKPKFCLALANHCNALCPSN